MSVIIHTWGVGNFIVTSYGGLIVVVYGVKRCVYQCTIYAGGGGVFVITRFKYLGPGHAIFLMYCTGLFRFFCGFYGKTIYIRDTLFGPVVVFSSMLRRVPFGTYGIFKGHGVGRHLTPFTTFYLGVFVTMFYNGTLYILNCVYTLVDILKRFGTIFMGLGVTRLGQDNGFFSLITNVIGVRFTTSVMTNFFGRYNGTITSYTTTYITCVRKTYKVNKGRFRRGFFTFTRVQNAMVLTPNCGVFGCFQVVSLQGMGVRGTQPHGFGLFGGHTLRVGIVHGTLNGRSQYFFRHLYSHGHGI